MDGKWVFEIFVFLGRWLATLWCQCQRVSRTRCFDLTGTICFGEFTSLFYFSNHILFPLAILNLLTLEFCSPQPVTEPLLRKSSASSHGSRQRILLDSEWERRPSDRCPSHSEKEEQKLKKSHLWRTRCRLPSCRRLVRRPCTIRCFSHASWREWCEPTATATCTISLLSVSSWNLFLW